MKALFVAAVAAVVGMTACRAEDKKVTTPLEGKLKDIDGNDYDLAKLKGKVVMFVNVASECGLTPQYAGLQDLYDKYAKDGFVLVGVPANEFGKQEPGTDGEIKKFCTTKYKVTFPMMSKVVVKGADKIALYKTLTAATPDKDGKVQEVSWNFEKFLIGRDGKVAARFAPRTEPLSDEVQKAVKAELAKPEK
jgi:glutathione peroxidase